MSSTVERALLEVFVGRRMVLDVPCGDGDWLASLAERNVPVVGLDPRGACVRAVRDRTLSAWHGGLEALLRRPESFDGIRACLPPGSASEREVALATLTGALVVDDQGGTSASLLVLHETADSGPLPSTDELHQAGLDEKWRGTSAVITFLSATRAQRVARLPWLAPTVGPYADLFAGFERVLELGSGAGRFLDALHVRGVGGVLGVECHVTWRHAVAESPFEILDVESESAAARLLQPAAAGMWNGIYTGHLLDTLSPGDRGLLLVLLARLLSPPGIAVCRVRRTWPESESAAVQAKAQDLGLRAERREWGRDAEDVFWIFRHGQSESGTDVAADPAALEYLIPRLRAPERRSVDRPFRTFDDLERFEKRVMSQCGDDGVLEKIFERIGTTDRFYVEFGCGDGSECNTARLREEASWRGVLMDGVVPEGHDLVHKEWITAESIEELFRKHEVPPEFDLMSIDLDGNDFWVWRALARSFRPRVVIAEYNANFGSRRAVSIPNNPSHTWDGTDHYGASLAALDSLAKPLGYTLVYCNQAGVNAVFLRNDVLPHDHQPRSPQDLFHEPNYFYRRYRQAPNLERDLTEVSKVVSV